MSDFLVPKLLFGNLVLETPFHGIWNRTGSMRRNRVSGMPVPKQEFGNEKS